MPWAIWDPMDRSSLVANGSRDPGATTGGPVTETKDGNFGRSRFEVVYRRSYITEEEFSARGGSDDQYIWMDPSRWNLAPSPLQGRRVALVGNTPILGCGQVINSFDEVIRMNRMEYWRQSAADDGARITVWAGLPRNKVLYGARSKRNHPESSDQFSRHCVGALDTLVRNAFSHLGAFLQVPPAEQVA